MFWVYWRLGFFFSQLSPAFEELDTSLYERRLWGSVSEGWKGPTMSRCPWLLNKLVDIQTTHIHSGFCKACSVGICYFVQQFIFAEALPLTFSTANFSINVNTNQDNMTGWKSTYTQKNLLKELCRRQSGQIRLNERSQNEKSVPWSGQKWTKHKKAMPERCRRWDEFSGPRTAQMAHKTKEPCVIHPKSILASEQIGHALLWPHLLIGFLYAPVLTMMHRAKPLSVYSFKALGTTPTTAYHLPHQHSLHCTVTSCSEGVQLHIACFLQVVVKAQFTLRQHIACGCEKNSFFQLPKLIYSPLMPAERRDPCPVKAELVQEEKQG